MMNRAYQVKCCFLLPHRNLQLPSILTNDWIFYSCIHYLPSSFIIHYFIDHEFYHVSLEFSWKRISSNVFFFSKARLLNELNEKELQSGSANTTKSWHHVYRDSAWIYVGGLDFQLTEGDVICVFSQ